MAFNNTTATLKPLEQMVSDTFVSIFGDPLLIGVMLLIVVIGIVVFARLSIDAAIVALIPMSFIIFEFIPALRVPAAIIFAVIAAFGFLRLIRQ